VPFLQKCGKKLTKIFKKPQHPFCYSSWAQTK
jgi:hypothetical protein